MMTEKKIGSFKIGETQRAVVKSSKKDEAAMRQAQSEAMSVGFRRIETILEEEDLAQITQKLEKIRTELAAFEARSQTSKDKAAARKAQGAVERTLDLMEYLYQIKERMVAEAITQP
jgi:hypothetical protein